MSIRPTERFTDRVSDYARHRPSYPSAAFDAIVAGLPEHAVAADIGAGTGISTRLLLNRGISVHAIEPNSAMRSQGEGETVALLGSLPRRPRGRPEFALWHESTGEATGLPGASVDLVLCAQSFHWLDADAALAEFRRILKPGGRAALVWNVHDTSSAPMAEYRDIVMRHATDPPRSPWFSNTDCALGTQTGRRAGFREYARIDVPNTQDVDLAGLMGRAFSSSYMPKDGPRRERAERALEAMYQTHQHGGILTLRYTCEVHIAHADGGYGSA